MKYFFYLCFFFITSGAAAQQAAYGSLVIRSDNEGPFFMYLDGIRLNETPQTCIRAVHLEKYSYHLRIEFTDNALNAVEKQKLFICNKKGEKKEFTYNFMKDSGSLKLNFLSMLPVKNAYEQEDTVFVYDAVPSKKNQARTGIQKSSIKVEKADSILSKKKLKSSDKEKPGEYGSLVIQSKNEGPFFLYLDGVQLNEEPQYSIRAIHLKSYSYALKIIFRNTSLNNIEKQKLFICNKKGEKKQFTYELVKDSGLMKLNFVSMLPVPQEYESDKTVFVFDPLVTVSKASSSVVKKEVENQVKPVVSADTASLKSAEKKIIKKAVEQDKQPDGIVNSLVLMEPKNWTCQRVWPMDEKVYADGLSRIDASPATEKLKIAKSFAEAHCLKTDQVMEITRLLDTEPNKLEFAKFSYSHTIDIKNYLKIVKLFETDPVKSDFIYFISH